MNEMRHKGGDMARYGIIVDLNRCTGCMTCVIACKQENLTRPGVSWNKVLEVENETFERIVYFRYACMHCEDPPCAKACPNGAIYKREGGIVLVDQDKCRGAHACVAACPYGVISINPDEEYFPGENVPLEAKGESNRVHPPGKASMCTLCAHRIDEGREPACVVACPSQAMTFVDLDDSQNVKPTKFPKPQALLASEGSNPKVRYIVSNDLFKDVERRISKKADVHS